MEALQLTQQEGQLEITDFYAASGVAYISVPLEFKTYGKPLHTAPLVVLINRHSAKEQTIPVIDRLKEVIGENKFIDTGSHSVLEFSFPGGTEPGFIYESYRNFSSEDLDALLTKALETLELPPAFATIKVG